MKFFETHSNDTCSVIFNRYQDIYVALSIRSEQLVANNISSWLCLTPTYAFDRGDRFLTKTGNAEIVRQYGLWKYESKKFINSDSLDDHIEFILSTFEPKCDLLQRYLADNAYHVCVQFSFEEEIAVVSCELSKIILQRLLSICNNLSISLYCD